MSAYLIAELGANHQGSLTLAKTMVNNLVGSGVSAIKTCKQSMKEEWKTMPYDSPNSFGATYYDHRKALELSEAEFIELADYVRSKGFDFIASFTDIESLDFLVEKVNPRYYKIPSSRVTDIELLEAARKINWSKGEGYKIILSTGMSTPNDILEAVMIVVPKVIMHCTSSYPCKEEDLNLSLIEFYLSEYKATHIGFSGHHLGIEPDLYAYAMGAKFIERHYTFDKEAKGTDHKLSLTADEFKELSRRLTELDVILGSGEKKILDCELPAMNKLRSDL